MATFHDNSITKNIDFVIPIKKSGIFTKAVLEGIELFYEPQKIFVITNKYEILLLRNLILYWSIPTEKVIFIDENLFFKKGFELTMADIEDHFDKTENSKKRDFGWWYQQLIKMGAATQIDSISENYVVWDADLIPLKKWSLAENFNEKINYYTAVLQEVPRSIFNKEQYDQCIRFLLGYDTIEPIGGKGTFVTHHMTMNCLYMKELIDYICKKNSVQNDCWPIFFISLSSQFFRFSEYKIYSTFMSKNYPEKFFYHPFEKYGSKGFRYRENDETNKIINDIYLSYPNQYGISYKNIKDYFNHLNKEFSYVQFEHIYFNEKWPVEFIETSIPILLPILAPKPIRRVPELIY